MKFTKTEDYSLFLTGEIAKSFGKKALSLSDISVNSGISVYYLKQLVRPLVKSGLLLSKEGSGGGYYLSRKPSSISVYDILHALNKLPKLSPCLSGKNCLLSKVCHNNLIWEKVNYQIIGSLKKIKLSEVL